MKKTMTVLYVVVCCLWVSTIFAQGAPEPINDAIADLSNRVGRSLTIGDLENWFWSQAGYTAPCADAAPVDAVGYQFLLTFGGQVYDYRVTADRNALFLCSVMPVDGEQQAPTPEPVDGDEPPYSNPLCPTPPEGMTFMRTRLVPEIQARVSEGLPNRVRDNPNTEAAIVGEIPGGTVFNVVTGPSCDLEGRLWWAIDYDGLLGWTAEVSGGDYLIEPFPAALLPAERGFITAESAEFVQEVSRLQGNFGERIAFTPTTDEQPSFSLVALGGTGSEAAFIYDVNALDQPPRMLNAPNRLTQVRFAANIPSLGFFGDSDGAIRVWDIAPNAGLLERAFLLGHNTAVSALVVDRPGERIASSGGMAFLSEQRDDNEYAIVLWDVNTVSQMLALRGHTDTVTSIAFGPPGVMASAGLDQTVRLWSLEDGAVEVRYEAPGAINDLIFHSNLSQLALGLVDGNIVIMGAFPGEFTETINAHTAPVTSLDEYGGLLASGGEDGVVYLWDIANLETPLATLANHTGAVTDVVFSPDGTLLASVGEDHTIRIWAVVQSVG